MEMRDHQILKEFSAKVRQPFLDAKIWAVGSRARGNAQRPASHRKIWRNPEKLTFFDNRLSESI
jgi:hypothetical protein